MRKRDSLRRWKARRHLGRAIPAKAIMDYDLGQWFRFTTASFLTDHCFPIGTYWWERMQRELADDPIRRTMADPHP